MSRPIPVSPEKWGEMVLALSEVRQLREENARLKGEVERLTNCQSEADRLKAEVERLRQDLVAVKYYGELLEFLKANAAKEGKPSEQKSPSFIEDLGNGVEKHDLLFRHPDKEGKQP